MSLDASLFLHYLLAFRHGDALETLRSGLTVQEKPLTGCLAIGDFRLMDSRGRLAQQVYLGNLYGSGSGCLKSHLTDFAHIVTGKKAFGLFCSGIDPNLYVFIALNENLSGDGGGLGKLEDNLGII